MFVMMVSQTSDRENVEEPPPFYSHIRVNFKL
jgi:hypothetical protein